MMEVTLTINGLDVHKILSAYAVTKEISYRKVITTLDDIEHPYPGAARDVVTFSLLPMTDAEGGELYNALRGLVVPVTYTNQYTGVDETRTMRVTSNLESAFALLSCDGKRRYKGGAIQLRGL